MSDLVKQLRDYINFVDDIELRRIAANQLEQLEAKVVTQQARIEQLVGTLDYLQCHVNHGGALWRRIRNALSIPDDLSALRAHDEKLLATTTLAAKDVLAERERQKSVEGWTPEHDDQHRKGALAAAGGCYALFADYYLAEGHPPEFWPWDAKWWKPSLARRNLIKAGALIVAEIERLDRADAIEKDGV
jgi:hypothetical protein